MTPCDLQYGPVGGGGRVGASLLARQPTGKVNLEVKKSLDVSRILSQLRFFKTRAYFASEPLWVTYRFPIENIRLSPT